MISISSKLVAWKSDFYTLNDADEMNQSIGWLTSSSTGHGDLFLALIAGTAEWRAPNIREPVRAHPESGEDNERPDVQISNEQKLGANLIRD